MSKHRGRKVPPLSPAQIRRAEVITAQPDDERAWEEIEKRPQLDRHVIAAGSAQNTHTGLYHAWISLYGNDLTSWYVGDDLATANAIVAAIKELFREWRGDAEDIESMDALIDVAREKTLAGHHDDLLPDEQVREILAHIADLNQRKN